MVVIVENTDMKKKILMIGAGIGQMCLSKKIKEKGGYLICVTLPGQPVEEIADKVYHHDVFDKEWILQTARKEGIDAVISDQNDLMMPTVAYIAEHMNLPGLRISQAEAYCNKNIFTDNCERLHIPVPRHAKVHGVEIPHIFHSVPFPWVVKPADAQSSVGVKKVACQEEYYAAVKDALHYSRTGYAIVEEFFNGIELVAEGFIYKGKYYNLGFADRKYFRLKNIFIPSQAIFPSVAPPALLQELRQSEERMAAYINPEFAIVHSEYLYNKDSGKYTVVESALRGGGVYISSHLVPLYNGIDINDVLYECIIGNEINMDEILKKHADRAAAYMCFYLPKGTICKVEGIEEVSQWDFVKMMCLDGIKVGMQTSPLTHKGQRLGPIIVSGRDRADIDRNISRLQAMLRISVKNEKGEIKGINWK